MFLRAHNQIIDPEVKEAILFMRRGVAYSTVDRRIEEGVSTIPNTLKIMGFFEDLMEFK
ncbi:MAG TPA: hypothetical protein VGI33_09735 [Paenibacillus sp.]|jgi:hypothetical protein